MKKTIFSLFLAGAFGLFYSCENDGVLQDESLIEEIAASQLKVAVGTEDMSEEMLSYMETEYASHLTEVAYRVRGKGYELELESGINVYFNERNRCLGHRPHPDPRFRCLRGDSIGVAELPQEILDYVADNFPDESLEVAVVKPFGLYAVGLSNRAVLIFDEEGAFLSRCGRWDGPGQHGHRCMRGEEVAIADLPQSISDYVTDNYAGETIEKASTKPNGVYAVKLSNDSVLLFDTDGEFIRECRG